MCSFASTGCAYHRNLITQGDYTMKAQYITAIIKLLKETDDIELLDLIHQILKKAVAK